MSTTPVLVLLASMGMVVPAGTQSAARAVTLQPLAPGLWTAPVDAGATATGWHFLVDTGSTHTILSALAARRAGLPVAAGGRLLTPAGPVEVGATRLPVLRLGDRVRRDVPVLVADLSALGRDPRIDGILGMDVLDAERVVLDLAAGELTLVDGASDHVPRRGTALPTREVAGRLVVEARLDGRARTLVLDSGAAATVVYDEAPAGAAVDLMTAGGVASGRTRRTELAVGAVIVGPVRAVRLLPPAVPTGAHGLLPAALFARIDIDRRAGLVRLIPRR